MFHRNLGILRVLNCGSSRLYLSTKHQKPEAVPYDVSYPPEKGCVRKSPYLDILIPNMTVDQYVWKNYQSWETKIATVCGVTDRKYTYAELRDRSAAFAVRLQTKFNLRQDEVVAICLPNIPEFPIATLGAIEAGLVVTTVNPSYTAEEISRQLIDSNANMVITTVMQFKIVEKARELAQKNIPIVTIRTERQDETIPSAAINFGDLMNPQGVEFNSLIHYNRSIEDVTFLPYSSGTTGLPKGVQLTHRNLTANSEMLQVEMKGTRLILPTTSTFQDVLPCILPFFHIYGITCTLFSKLTLGCQLVTLPKFVPEVFLSALAKYKGTMLHLVPPIVIFMGHHDQVKKEHVESIRTVMSGAAPMGQSDAERFIARAPGVKFIQGYGLTETAPVVMFGEQGFTNFTSVGKPLPKTEAKIVDLSDPTFTGLPPGPGNVGELFVRGPQIMKGYLNNEKATKDMIVENGWLRTGDLAYYDEEDHFYITDRLKELIKVKGFQVAPAELEEIVRSHPKVLDAAVVGVPDRISGEVPRAFVVKKGEVTEDELKEYVAQKVAKYKRLDGGVTFLEAIPKNASGKILRREIRMKYC